MNLDYYNKKYNRRYGFDDMTLNDYFFCIDYDYYQNKEKIPISDCLSYYNKTYNMSLNVIEIKRLFNKYKDQAFEMLNDNITYCQKKAGIYDGK